MNFAILYKQRIDVNETCNFKQNNSFKLVYKSIVQDILEILVKSLKVWIKNHERKQKKI